MMLEWKLHKLGLWHTAQFDGRELMISRSHEQPEYWFFFRGDGNYGLICGPTFEDAVKFSNDWAEKMKGKANEQL